uniref:Glycoside hydrolase family 28 n=1 Tax=Sipyloidea sipylus TaxID=202427 RepID=A0A191XT54_SIPSI|nr:glycoside hydrolase family 28 [Sipyloidea sipylus]
MRHQSFSFLAIGTFFALVHVGTARDLRNVTEPKTPQACAHLKATGEDDTKIIQNALDSCAKGKAVALSYGTFYSGPLTIPSGVSLLVESGVMLKAIPDPKLYDLGENLCGTIDDLGLGCKPFITMHGAKGSGIYGKGTINGQGGSVMTGSNITWWHLARNAVAVRKFQNNPRLIQINNSIDITIYQITLKNPPFYHLTASETNGYTVWGITIQTPTGSLNSDGIDAVGCQNVTIANCNISTGDDNIGLKALTAPGRYMSVLNTHINRGNSMAIGSETNYGVSDALISGMTINGTYNGIYIKSNTFRGGRTSNIVFENICISNVGKPINLDTAYYNMKGNSTPVFQNITLRNVWVQTNGTIVIHGMSNTNPIVLTLDDVHVPKGTKYSVRHANITGKWQEDATGSPCGFAGNGK